MVCVCRVVCLCRAGTLACHIVFQLQAPDAPDNRAVHNRAGLRQFLIGYIVFRRARARLACRLALQIKLGLCDEPDTLPLHNVRLCRPIAAVRARKIRRDGLVAVIDRQHRFALPDRQRLRTADGLLVLIHEPPEAFAVYGNLPINQLRKRKRLSADLVRRARDVHRQDAHLIRAHQLIGRRHHIEPRSRRHVRALSHKVFRPR